MEAKLALDRDANHRQPPPNRGPKLADLISEAQGSQILPSEPDDATGAPLRACRSLSKAINCSSVHSPLPEKDLEFLDGVPPPTPPQGRMTRIRCHRKKPIIQSPHRPPFPPLRRIVHSCNLRKP